MKTKERKVNIDILRNMIYALIIATYFIFLMIGTKMVSEELLTKYIKVSSMVFLIVTICIFEKAYKDDDGKTAIHGIEFLVLSIHTILLEYLSNVFDKNIYNYIAISVYAFLIYYIIKSMIIYTKFRKQQLDSLSDIAEIVKENPTKKEPTRREKIEEKEIKEEVKEKVKTTTKRETKKKTEKQTKKSTGKNQKKAVTKTATAKDTKKKTTKKDETKLDKETTEKPKKTTKTSKKKDIEENKENKEEIKEEVKKETKKKTKAKV